MNYANDNCKKFPQPRVSEEELDRLIRNAEAALRRYRFKVVSCND